MGYKKYLEYLDCGWIFAQHFCNRLGPAYLQLRNVLNEDDPMHAELLSDIKRRFREETFTPESIAQVIHAHPNLVSCFSKTSEKLLAHGVTFRLVCCMLISR